MKLQMLGAVLAACVAAGTVSAQSGSATSAPQAQNRDAAGTVRVTGCVERADQMMPLAGAALGTTVDSQEFVLIRSQIAGAEPSAATAAPTGTSGVAGSANRPNDPGQMFRLDAAPAMMNPLVGHRVEVVGSRDSAAPAPPQDPSNPTAARAPLLRVTSVKSVSDTCPR